MKNIYDLCSCRSGYAINTHLIDGLRDKIEGYKKEIASFATLYDMEFDSSFCDAENFRDNMHLSYAGRIRFIDALVSGKDEGLKIRGPGIAE